MAATVEDQLGYMRTTAFLPDETKCRVGQPLPGTSTSDTFAFPVSPVPDQTYLNPTCAFAVVEDGVLTKVVPLAPAGIPVLGIAHKAQLGEELRMLQLVRDRLARLQ